MSLKFFVKSSTFLNFKEFIEKTFKNLTDTLANDQKIFDNYVDQLFEKYVKLEHRIGNLESSLYQAELAERLHSAEEQLRSLAPYKVGDKVYVKFEDGRKRTEGTVVQVKTVDTFAVAITAPEDSGVDTEIVERKDVELRKVIK